ncbi:MAG: hypothetical protein HY922_16750, partial [Elusimicrobia bacterium]|nr:hypothetical protein [Elusimicrobiota bacterium]
MLARKEADMGDALRVDLIAPAAEPVDAGGASRPSFSRPRRALRKTILPGLGLALLLCAWQGALLPVAAAEYEVSAASFTVDNQINISSAVYIQQMTNAPVSPAINTKLANPGGLYFNGTRYLVWDNNASAWVQLTTGAATVTGSGTANVFPIWGASSALSNGLLVKDGAASVTVMSSTLTVQGQDASGYSLKAAYGIRAGSATLSAGLGASSATVRSNAASSPLLVSTSPTPGVVGLYVDGINNVGVGTTGPGQRLDV